MPGRSKFDLKPYQKYADGTEMLVPGTQDYQTLVQRLASDRKLAASLNYEGYQAAQQGDFSQFEHLSPLLRNLIASEEIHRIGAAPPGSLIIQGAPATQQTENFLKANAMNPAFRLGCSLMSRSIREANSKNAVQKPDPFPAYDDFMSTHIMEQTLKPLDSGQIKAVREMNGNDADKTDSMLTENIEKQVQLAKTLFAVHMGKVQLKTTDADGVSSVRDYDRSVTCLMSHCSRALMILPRGRKDQVSAMMNGLAGGGGDIYRRTFATHATENADSPESVREQKKKGGYPVGQRGMDLAIGGLGNQGIGGPKGTRQILKNNGSCGHLYMHVNPGGPDRLSSLLIGFESDSPRGGYNQQGHHHSILASPEYMSSFLGQRSDETGDKYGGRLVDCSGIDIDLFNRSVQTFEEHYRGLALKAINDPAMRNRLEQVNKALSGKPMDAASLFETLNAAGLSQDDARRTVRDSGKGTPGTVIQMQLPHHPEPEINAIPSRKKPGGWTKMLAFFGNDNAKKQIHDYQDYQSDISRAVSLKMLADRPAPAGSAKKPAPADSRNTDDRKAQKTDFASMVKEDLESRKETGQHAAAPGQKKTDRPEKAADLSKIPPEPVRSSMKK